MYDGGSIPEEMREVNMFFFINFILTLFVPEKKGKIKK